MQKFLIPILIISFLIGDVNAQFKRRRDIPDFDRPNFRHRHEKIQAIYLWKLIDYLELSEEQVNKFTPRLKKHQDQMEKKRQELFHFYRNLMDSINEGKAFTDKDVQETLDNVTKIQCEMANLEREFIMKQGDILTPEQQIKFLVFNERFRQQIKKFLREPE